VNNGSCFVCSPKYFLARPSGMPSKAGGGVWSMADKLLWFLIVEYVVLALAYAWQRDWPRCGYFVSAAGISLSVLGMR